jgi:glycosyltransferase involved in cell wall biosynthesis
VGRINCHRKRNKFFCQLCSLGRNPAPPLAEYRKFPAVVLSEFMRENLLKNGFTQVVKVPPFIRTEETAHTFMPDGVLRLLFLGQLIRGKGADLLLNALAKLTIPFFCTIAGDGNDRQMLENMAERLGLSGKVHFTGFVSEPETLWQDCDVFCFTIRWQEPFGLVALEAMAHGIPVAAFDLGGVREYLDDKVNGVLLPEKDLTALAEVLTGWAKEPQELARMGKNGFNLTKERFSEENFVEKFSTFTEVLK